MSNTTVLWGDGEQAAVFNWWAKLAAHDRNWEGNRIENPWPPAIRAALRHAETPDEALLTEGFRLLWFSIPGRLRKPERMLAWACATGLLAHIRTHVPNTEIATSMAGRRDPASEKPHVSELRFRQLMQTQDIVELHRRLRRLLPLLRRDGRIEADVLSLADSILHWDQEQRTGPNVKPSRRFPVRWSTAYYTELARYQPATTN